jgi:hypothetical protein
LDDVALAEMLSRIEDRIDGLESFAEEFAKAEGCGFF